MTRSSKPYGFELIMDLNECDVSRFNRMSLDGYFETLCKTINMVRCERYFWDDLGVPQEERQTAPHTTGTSAVQFILTSSVVVHTLDLLQAAYINVFSCKPFDRDAAEKLTKEWFDSKECKSHFIKRG